MTRLITKKWWLILLIILISGFIIRLKSFSNFNIYPDSYSYLVLAKIIAQSGKTLGTLGQGGMIYQHAGIIDYNWGFSLLVALIYKLGLCLFSSGRLVVLLFSLSSILAFFYLIRNITKNIILALVGALLLTFSYNHLVWSTFIGNDLPALALGLIIAVILSRSRKIGLIIFAGVLLGLVVKVRLEYTLLIFFYGWLIDHFQKEKLTNSLIFYGSAIFTFIILTIIFQTKPYHILPYSISQLINILSGQVYLFLILLVSLIGWIIILKKWPQSLWVVLIGWAGLIIYLFLGLFGMKFLLPGWLALRDIIIRDPLIIILGVVGIGYLIIKKRYLSLALIIALTVIILSIFYNKVNNFAIRYLLHFEPLLLLAGLIMLSETLNRRWKIVMVGIIIIGSVFLQTWNALRPWHPKIDYAQASAQELNQVLELDQLSKSTILVTFLIEPYWLYTGIPTWQVAPEKPYLNKDFLKQDKDYLVVIDQGMRDQRQQFAQWATKNLGLYLVDSYSVEVMYYYGLERQYSSKPVMVYLVPNSKMKQLINLN